MEIQNKLTIKKALRDNEVIGRFLQRGSPDLGFGISKLSELTGLNEYFIRLNIDQIRNWI